MPNIQIQLRRGTFAEWSNANPTLASGEIGLETTSSNFKIGNGITAWNSLSYSGLVGPTGPSGGGSTVTIAGYTGYGAITTIATGGTGIFGNSNLVYNSNTNMLTAGALTLANGFRPLYQRIESGSATIPSTNAYGTYYDITTTALSNLTVSLPTAGSTNWSNDSNGFWVFRNNTGSYIKLDITYTNGTANIYPTSIEISPGNSTTLMVTYPGGGTNSNYILF